MTPTLQTMIENLESGFYGFRVKRWRVTFLVMGLLLVMGGYAIISIPKESAPDVQIGILSINTSYPGVDPISIDSLITQKLEKEIKEVEGIKKITSTSRQGVSSIVVELQNDVDITNTLVSVKDAVDKTQLPGDANDPIVIENNQPKLLYTVTLYADANNYSQSYLKQKALELQEELEGKYGIKDLQIQGGSDYDIEVLLDRAQLEGLKLSVGQIANILRSNNNNQPLGNFEINNKKYDFRIDGEFKSLEDIRNTIIPLQQGGSISLGDIADIQIYYRDESQKFYGSYQKTGYVAQSITFIKEDGISIFDAVNQSKEALSELFLYEKYGDISYAISNDVGENIKDDYKSLASNGGQTILVVFLCLLLFIGFKESFIASITIPLAFCITFFVLRQLGLSMNFLTNFSLIITFGIAIDTTIVIIEGAHERMKLGYGPKTSVLLAVDDYKYSLIAGTATTCFAFLPMLTLPGVLGKYLAYIPITIFVTLIAALIISLTVNSALYYKLSTKQKTYIPNPELEKFLKKDELTLLQLQRAGKKEVKNTDASKREQILENISIAYENFLHKLLHKPMSRLLSILIPMGVFALSFIPLATGMIGFEIFPASDVDFMSFSIKGQQGVTAATMEPHIAYISNTLASYPIIESRNFSLDGSSINGDIQLVDSDTRKKNKLGNVFDLEEGLRKDFDTLLSFGLAIETNIPRGGPPSDGGSVGIKLIGENARYLEDLIATSQQFESFLQQYPGTKNISNSSDTTPGQFIFSYELDKLAFLGLSPQDISSELFAATQGINAGTLQGIGDDYTIRIKYNDLAREISPSDIENLIINTKIGPITLGDVVRYTPSNAVNSLRRENGKLLITVGADVTMPLTPDKVQGPLIDFAKTYSFPAGVSYEAGGENQENQDLLTAMVIAFFVALILIFSTLVLQFNSYIQPAIILFSVVMAVIGVNFGLFVTGNPFSLAVMIGFISLTGIVVNDAIVFISRVNSNIENGMDITPALAETGRARLQPIILTTLTTVLGLQSVARMDEFWAGLAYTIMFGLAVGSVMTLLGVPVLYFEKDKLIQMIKRGMISPILLFLLLGAIAGTLFGLNRVIGSIIPQQILLIVIGIVCIALIGYLQYDTIVSRQSTGQSYLQAILKIKILTKDKKYMTRELAIRRYIIHRAFILPILILFGLGMGGFGALLLIILIFANIISIRLSDSNQSIHDRIVGTIVVDTEEESD